MNYLSELTSRDSKIKELEDKIEELEDKLESIRETVNGNSMDINCCVNSLRQMEQRRQKVMQERKQKQSCEGRYRRSNPFLIRKMRSPILFIR